ncbi:MAG TPA: glycosyltransferase family 4 protein [Usitatibacter sp.]|nr:glycosyltransferase family 4 protein [Usitatibacter sp.]
MNRPVVVILGPDRAAISGVSTHVNLLMGSALGDDFELVHFQVGSEGRGEGFLAKWLRLLLSPFALFATILFRHACLVHINSSLNTRAYWRDLMYLAVAKLLRARVVYQVHGGKLPQVFFAGRPGLTKFLRRTLMWPDVVVVLARCELEAYRDFLPGQHVVVIPNGIDCAPFAGIPIVRSQPEYPLRLIYIGRLDREKGLYETLQAMRLAHELGVDTRITIAGAGSEEGRLKRYAQALGLASRVCFTGPVFGEDKVRLLAGADVMVLPSYSEGLPYALLEAMAGGIPVVATPVGAIPDVVTHGIHGFLVRARDGKAIAEALAVLSGDRERISWMSRACKRRIRAAYAIDRVAAQFATHYAQLVDGFVVAGVGEASVPVPRPASSAPRKAEKIAGRKD